MHQVSFIKEALSFARDKNVLIAMRQKQLKEGITFIIQNLTQDTTKEIILINTVQDLLELSLALGEITKSISIIDMVSLAENKPNVFFTNNVLYCETFFF